MRLANTAGVTIRRTRGGRGYLPFLVSFLSFFSFVVSLGLFVFPVRFLFLSLDMDQEYPAIAREARPQGSSAG